MGTNYYAEMSIHGVPINLHIGKSSVGWKFLFAEYSNLRSWADWLEFLTLDDVKIVDEYGQSVEVDDLARVVRHAQKPTNLDYLNAPSSMWGGPLVGREIHERLDADGYRFSRSEPEDWS